MRQQLRKEKLLATAYQLFNKQGYHSTGIDQILEESGVAKATLYKYFSSKEELIIEVLKRRHDELEHFLTQQVNQREGTSRILAIFDAYDTWFHSPQFQGCNFINASAEYGDVNHPIHCMAAKHKGWLKQLLLDLLPTKADASAEALAEQLLLLLDGAIVTAQVRRQLSGARVAREVAEILLQQSFGSH